MNKKKERNIFFSIFFLWRD